MPQFPGQRASQGSRGAPKQPQVQRNAGGSPRFYAGGSPGFYDPGSPNFQGGGFSPPGGPAPGSVAGGALGLGNRNPTPINDQLQDAFANQPGTRGVFSPTEPLKPSANVNPGKQIRRQTALNGRVENLLGRFDDFAQGDGQGLDALIKQALQGSIDPNASQFAQQRANFASDQLANQVALAQSNLRSGLGAAGRSAPNGFLSEQLALQGASADAQQRFNIFDQERQYQTSLLDALMGRNIQRGQTLGGLNFTGYKAPSDFDRAAPLIAGGLQGVAAGIGAGL